MKRLLFGISLLVFLVSCSGDGQNSHQNSNYTFQQSSSENLNSNLIEFKGDKIELDEFHTKDSTYIVQINEKKKSDIYYRAKRIPNKMYLLNKGVPQEEIDQAVEESKNEELYYFEFEDEAQVDLIDKHFENDPAGKIAYLSFNIYQDFYLLGEEGDTIKANYSIYEHDHHVAPYERILLSFTGVTDRSKYTLVYEDRLFGNGSTSFHFIPENSLENYKNPS